MQAIPNRPAADHAPPPPAGDAIRVHPLPCGDELVGMGYLPTEVGLPAAWTPAPSSAAPA